MSAHYHHTGAAASPHHTHDHTHDHVSGHAHAHVHAHGPGTPHPAEVVPWSLLQNTVFARLTVAVAVCGLLWAAVFAAMA